MDMRTRYLGLELKNPLVPSASPLSRDLDKAKRLEDAGASAIVMYSLFEEEIRQEDDMLDRYFMMQDEGHVEADSYRPLPDDFATEIDDYLLQLMNLKQSLDIPVVASLNAVSLSSWVSHAVEIEQTGADALELNIYQIAGDADVSGSEVESLYIDTLCAVKKTLKIPVILKLSPQFSSVANMVKRLEHAGADGVSLFNRFYQPTIDLESLDVTPELNLSTSNDALLAMRWIAILHGQVNLTLAATSGIHTSEDALRMLLAGADVTHMCAALLKNGPEYLATVLRGMEDWMERNEYESVEQMKGSVSRKHSANPSAYERANYLRVLNSYGH